ncbi:hypothetical protein Y032_0050g1997 [Ancylostoma ceylanicum]|uniref:Uncharacterized protein n=1 Tax=Ancylostoma ceylanicum TaxID=53326 RepID=A0A016U9T2_9BILA|nr:hypothetical protein Y032_0050g1997 [Ancylostoma ceylanicum]
MSVEGVRLGDSDWRIRVARHAHLFQLIRRQATITLFITRLTLFEFKDGRDERPECANQSRIATPFFSLTMIHTRLKVN